jgi:hypothetical protein
LSGFGTYRVTKNINNFTFARALSKLAERVWVADPEGLERSRRDVQNRALEGL